MHGVTTYKLSFHGLPRVERNICPIENPPSTAEVGYAHTERERHLFILSNVKDNLHYMEMQAICFRIGHGDSNNRAIMAFGGRRTSVSQSNVAWPPW